MPDALTAINLRNTPQTQPATPTQVKNNAGGYTFTVDPAARLRRFLVLGTDGGTYYTGERKLTRANAAVIIDWATNRTAELVDELVTLSLAGRAPKQNPTLFALAAAASLGDDDGRKAALDALTTVARTGTHLFLFARYVEQFRGWGRGLRRAVADWYSVKPAADVAYQAVKYRQREGWSHRDLLRLAHPTADSPERAALFDWICGRESDVTGLPVVEGFQAAQAATTVREWVSLVESFPLSWEMLPDAALTEKAVWSALVVKGMPQTALIRQLPRLTRLGVVAPMGGLTGLIAEQVADAERLRKARVHPLNVLVAERTYSQGASMRGDSTWSPHPRIVDALGQAFYAAFGAVEPANKRTLLALDVSGSMTAPISGMPLSCREASAALSLVTAATEPETYTVGFTSDRGRGHGSFWGGAWGGQAELTPLAISPQQRLGDVMQTVSNMPFGGTDCALPMLWAKANNVEVDTFVVYTDNETWAGSVHPHQALRDYRSATGINARLAVVGMTATDFTIADPNDPGMLDVAGFDTAVPSLIGDFSRHSV